MLAHDDVTAALTRLTGDEKHDRSSYSTLDVLRVLFDRVLGPDDRFMLSKGHGPAAFYAVLAAKGLIPADALDGFGSFDSILGYHPDRTLVPAAGIGSGSLGHGLPIAVGSALAGRRVVCLVGDAELDEGSNWEAVQYAGRIGLASLTAVVIDNRSSTYHWPGGVEARFALEGWTATVCDGRDHDAIARAFADATGERPHVVVAEIVE
ncbi:MAG: transketolase [Actinobacteria bacterium]|nr:transketolase [Actinomycetota bacterium]MBV8481210.1 transketolase [Actinomycetota bacterium]MBV8598661.1 transketolase [Actinomycetota bacterium]